jgi:hypothetical protein
MYHVAGNRSGGCCLIKRLADDDRAVSAGVGRDLYADNRTSDRVPSFRKAHDLWKKKL